METTPLRCPSCGSLLMYLEEEQAWMHTQAPSVLCTLPTPWIGALPKDEAAAAPEPWCCMACCEGGRPLQGHFACTPTRLCGTGDHEPDCHGVCP